jgi:hypothetical protein
MFLLRSTISCKRASRTRSAELLVFDPLSASLLVLQSQETNSASSGSRPVQLSASTPHAYKVWSKCERAACVSNLPRFTGYGQCTVASAQQQASSCPLIHHRQDWNNTRLRDATAKHKKKRHPIRAYCFTELMFCFVKFLPQQISLPKDHTQNFSGSAFVPICTLHEYSRRWVEQDSLGELPSPSKERQTRR